MTKMKYWVGAFGFSFLILLSFIVTPQYEHTDLTVKKVKLLYDPDWRISRHRRHPRHWVELQFNYSSRKYKISGIDYKYLNYKAFKRNIRTGDSLVVGVVGKNILTLEKDGVPYLDFEKAQRYKVKTGFVIRGISFAGLICFMIPLLFKNYPIVKINGQNIELKDGILFLIYVIIVIIILCILFGSSLLTSGTSVK